MYIVILTVLLIFPISVDGVGYWTETVIQVQKNKQDSTCVAKKVNTIYKTAFKYKYVEQNTI